MKQRSYIISNRQTIKKISVYQEAFIYLMFTLNKSLFKPDKYLIL